MIFSRRSRAGRHAKADEPAKPTPAELRRAQREELLRELELEPDAEPIDPPGNPGRSRPAENGPYDFPDAPARGDRVDLGSLLVPAVDGVEIRLQAGEDGVIQQLVLAHSGSALQLGAFAAPRSEGLWDEVRGEIRKSLFDDGVGAQEVQGRWGTELRARLRTQDGFDDLRFIGVDGPRWMVRAVYQGPAALEPELSGPLYDCLTGLVVLRDEQARPTREPLPLRLPDQVQPVEQAPEPEQQPAQALRRRPSPRPRRD